MCHICHKVVPYGKRKRIGDELTLCHEGAFSQGTFTCSSFKPHQLFEPPILNNQYIYASLDYNEIKLFGTA